MSKNPPKHPKPWPNFPLTVHPNGQYSRKIRGRVHYFGPQSAGPDAAVELFNQQKDYLYAGLEPPIQGETVADLCNVFIEQKEQAVEQGELSAISLYEYVATTDIMVATLGRNRSLKGITPADLLKLRKALQQGKTKALGVSAYKRRLTLARIVLKFSNDEFDTNIKYLKSLAAPPAKLLRKVRNESAKKLFTAEQLRQIVKGGSPQIQLVTLLGICAGYGPQDCCTVPISAVDLKGGWIAFARPKTEYPRKAWLWPEAVKALKAAIGDRTSGPVLLDWTRHKVADEFRKAVDSFYVKGVHSHYSLRRTLATVATTADVPQAIINSLFGHVPPSHDMSAVYRQTIYDSQIKKCGEHCRAWYLGKVKL